MAVSFQLALRLADGRRGRRLPVVRVAAVSADAVQRPGGEPVPLVDLAAQRADHGRAGQISLPG
jgi:hypothetical protein